MIEERVAGEPRKGNSKREGNGKTSRTTKRRGGGKKCFSVRTAKQGEKRRLVL